MVRKRLGELLVERGLLKKADLQRALVEQKRWGGQLGSILIDLNLVPENTLVSVLSLQLGLPTINLDSLQIPSKVIEFVPKEFAEQQNLIPFQQIGKFLDVAMSDPSNSLGITDELRIRTRLNIRTYLAGPKAIEQAHMRYYNPLGRNSDYVEVPHFNSQELMLDTLSLTTNSQSAIEDPSSGFKKNGNHELYKIHSAEIRALQERISNLEALVRRDEDVIRKLLGLLVDKGVANREEIIQRIQ